MSDIEMLSGSESFEDEFYDETIEFSQVEEDIVHYEQKEDLLLDEIEEIHNFDYDEEQINNVRISMAIFSSIL